MYQVSIERQAQRALARIPTPQQDRIIAAVEALRLDPRPAGCRKLVDRAAWRIRVGDYRIIYEIQDERLHILIVRIGHRGEVYRG
ncbi:type II toxin-antitoxin system RelE/ParE family toxin [uncultured Thiodictyon sp.]|uniref:type II toxin-antitoxin system RelE family toxin n=1 Tax=uncultured Thiodictyon sp. TaxID=1846217 RepID=UPI0025DEB7DA|nr:type II toxin-antitoxin system RelE/ParE family toxin [uncultured Thiodictyon sp.]